MITIKCTDEVAVNGVKAVYWVEVVIIFVDNEPDIREIKISEHKNCTKAKDKGEEEVRVQDLAVEI